MSIVLAAKVQELERRLEALERAGVSRRLTALHMQAGVMRAQGDELRAEVRAILEAHSGSRRLKGYAVRSLLKRERLPSLRRVQEVMRQIKREAGGTAPNVGEHTGMRVV